MTKIAFIGAGSLEFTRKLSRDLMTFPLLQDATLVLMDINAERLDFAQKSVQKIVDLGNYPATVEATLDRVEAYIKDFLRVCIAYRQGYTVEGVRHPTGLSKRVVEKHLAHYAELCESSFWQEHLERKLRFYEASIDAELAQKGGQA